MVRQIETAALKAAGSNKAAPFERRLTALYTRSTIEAGDHTDIAGGKMGRGQGSVPDEDDDAPEPDQPPASVAPAALNSYLLCVVEAEQADSFGKAEIGVVAIETSTGDVLYAQVGYWGKMGK